MAWKCPPLHLFNWNNAWKWKNMKKENEMTFNTINKIMDKKVELQLAITKLVLQDPEPHLGLIEEALESFLLDRVGDEAELKEILDDTKNRIKVY